MVGEEFGWVPLDGWTLTVLIVGMSLLIVVPGFLVSLALFPKRAAMAISERLALSFGLGLTPIFILAILNMLLEVKMVYTTIALAAVITCALGVLGFLARGGNVNLIAWYKEKD